MLKKTKQKKNRRAAVIVWIAGSMVTLIGFGALAVDIGYMRVVKGQLQNAADAAALAGASALQNPGIYDNVSPGDKQAAEEAVKAEAISRAKTYASKHFADSEFVGNDNITVTAGNITDKNDLTEQMTSPKDNEAYNAVKAVVRRDNTTSFLKVHNTSLSATATAYLNTNVHGFHFAGKTPCIPVTMPQGIWDNQSNSVFWNDNYGYDIDSDEILNGPDGIKEISIYTNNSDIQGGGTGNFGLLDFGGGNAAGLVGDQIKNGLTSEEIKNTIGTDNLTFFDWTGAPITISQIPGLKASLKDDFAARIGDIVGIFVHDGHPILTGDNTIYTIVGIQFGRIMAEDFQGDDKVVIVQPATYNGSEVIIDDNATDHDTAGRIQLIR